MPTNWNEELRRQLAKTHDESKTSSLANKYSQAFPLSYQDETTAEVAANDVKYLEHLTIEAPITMHLYFLQSTNEEPLHLRLYQYNKPISLSLILPMLSNF